MLQVVNDITTFYMQTYNNYKTTGDERLKETLRVIQNGVSQSYFTSVLFYFTFTHNSQQLLHLFIVFLGLRIADSAEKSLEKSIRISEKKLIHFLCDR